MRKKRKITKYQWMLGFLGCMGFLGQNQHGMGNASYIFFAFFAFFSWYWEYQLQQEVEDERLIENRLKASNIAFPASLAVIFVGAVFSSSLLPKMFPALQNTLHQNSYLMILIGVGFAISFNLRSYLTFRFDTKE